MERRYEMRLRELLDEAVVSPEQVRGLLERLERFVEPFATCLVRSKQRELAPGATVETSSAQQCSSIFTERSR